MTLVTFNGVDLELFCPACDNGVIYSPEWAAWQSDLQVHAGKPWPQTSNEEVEAFIASGHPMPEGPEEFSCGECNGTGGVLTPSGRQLVEFMKRWL